MKKLKDFFYNKNDIIIVLIILAIAALMIYYEDRGHHGLSRKARKTGRGNSGNDDDRTGHYGKRENIGDHRRLRYSFDCGTEDLRCRTHIIRVRIRRIRHKLPAKNHLSKPAHTRYQLALCKKRS